MHPRLLSTLVLSEPVIMDKATIFKAPSPALMSTRRKDLWPSRSEAESSLRKGLASWDTRVVDRYLRFGLRTVPTPLYDPTTGGTIPVDAVTLTTSKHQEAWRYSVPNLEPASAGLDKLLLADSALETRESLFLRPECVFAMRALPSVRPSVLWVFGGKSYLSLPRM